MGKIFMPLSSDLTDKLKNDMVTNLAIKSESLRLASKIRMALNEKGWKAYRNKEWLNDFCQFLSFDYKQKYQSLDNAIFKAKVSSLEESVDFSIQELRDGKPGYTSSRNIIKRAQENYEWCTEWVEKPENNTKNTVQRKMGMK